MFFGTAQCRSGMPIADDYFFCGGFCALMTAGSFSLERNRLLRIYLIVVTRRLRPP